MKTTQLHSNYKTYNSKILFTIIAIVLVAASLFGQKVEIQGDANISGQLEVMDTILFSDGTTLASACLQILQDADSDTKIEVEKTADEDIIRFTINDVEIARFENNRLELSDGGGSVFIGYKAGESDDATGNKSVYIGYEAGQLSNGFANTAVGANSFQNNTLGDENTTLGVSAGYQSGGSNNVFVGRDAGRASASGNDNTYVGHDAGRSATGSSNVYLGKSAGETLAGSNKLAIDNTNTANPLIYGEFDNNLVKINGRLNINGAYDLPETVGSSGQVLSYDGSGALQWVNPGATSVFSDADGDTKIQVEESADEDIIRFDIAGNEVMTLDSKNLKLVFGGNSIAIGNKSGINDDGTNNANVFLGESAGERNISGSTNTFIGSFTGFKNLDGIFNTHVGSGAGYTNVSGDRNTTLGVNAGFKNQTSNDNTMVGHYAGFYNTSAANTFIGSNAGLNNLGSANVFIGYEAGKDVLGNNKLIIENSAMATPLIYGEFDNHKLELDAWTRVLRRMDIDNNDLLFSNIAAGTERGLMWSNTTAPKFQMQYSNLGIGNEKVNMQYNFFATTRDLMTWDDSGNVGVGTQNPARKFHVSTDTPTGHVMRIENTSSGSFASGLEILINRPVTGLENNYVTFRDANSVTGRIEGFALGEGPNFTDFPGIDFSAYFDLIHLENIVFDQGMLPHPDLNTWVPPSINFDRGTAPDIQDNSTIYTNNFITNVLCIVDPFCNHFDPANIDPIVNFDVSITGFERPTLTFDDGQFPDWVPGSRPELDISAILDPTIRTTAYADVQAIANWAIRNGIEVYTALDPWINKWMQDPEYWNNIALAKHGGVTYGSKGADYAEWLERENPSKDIKAGQIVGVKNGKISLNTDDVDQIMVISVMPIVLGNMPDSNRIEEFEKVAFIGQSPVWVVGEVESGDYIIASGQNDGYGLAVAEEELTIEQISKVVGRAWEDGDKIINLVNMAVGLKTNEMATILGKTSEKVDHLENRLAKVEAALGIGELTEK